MLLQDPRDDAPDAVLVLHDEDRLRARRRRCGLGAAPGPRLRPGPGQVDGEAGAGAGLAVHEDAAAVLLDDALHGGQPQPGALAAGLRGEEGVEDPVQRVGVHAGAVVAHGEAHVGARLEGLQDRTRRVRDVRRDLDIGRLHGERAAAGHGVPGVDGQVDEDLLRLDRVDEHGMQVLLQRQLHRDVLPEERGQHRLLLGDGGGEVHDLALDGLAAAEGQELPGQAGALLRRLLHLRDVPLPVRVEPGILQQQLGQAADHGEGVVEVVGDAAGELADGLELLRPAQPVLELLLAPPGPERPDAVRQVAGQLLQDLQLRRVHRVGLAGAHGEGAEAVAVGHQRQGGPAPDPRPQQLVAPRPGARIGRQVAEQPELTVPDRLVDRSGVAHGLQDRVGGFGAAPGDGAGPGIAVRVRDAGEAVAAVLHGDAAGLVQDLGLVGAADDHLVRRAEHPQRPVQGQQLPLPGHPLAVVHDDAHDADDPVPGVPERRREDLDGHLGAVLATTLRLLTGQHLTGDDAAADRGELVQPVVLDDGQPLADDLVRCPAERPLGGRVPAPDPALCVHQEDRDGRRQVHGLELVTDPLKVLLFRLPGRDVHDEAFQAEEPAFGVVDGMAALPDPLHFAVCRLDAVLDLEGPVVGQGGVHRGPDGLTVVRVDDFLEGDAGVADQVGGRVAGEALRAPAHELHGPVLIVPALVGHAPEVVHEPGAGRAVAPEGVGIGRVLGVGHSGTKAHA